MSTAMATTLPIPSRHPARLLQSRSGETATKATALTSEQLDVWEHATVLYHGFDWQTSAETFLFLSRTINRDLESTLCLLNAALIFARLGEYATASQILDEAEPNDQTLAFTMFLMGHVEFELGNFEKAEDSLKVALHSLKGSTQRFYDLGLEYTLRASHVQQSLRMFDESRNDLVGMLGSLGALPAGGVFEAPSRSHPFAAATSRPSTIRSRDSVDSGLVPALSEDRSSPSAPASPIESLEYASDYMQWHGLPEDPDVQIVAPTPMSKPVKVATLLDRLSGHSVDFMEPGKRASFASFTSRRKARKSEFEPREARVQGDSVRGLANFIRALPSQGKKQEPKEARVQDDSTTARLAEFLRTSGPGERIPPPQITADNASDRSVYSNEDSGIPERLTPADLHNSASVDEYAIKYRATPPPVPRHPYRSGFGSMLLQENMPSASHQKPKEPMSSDDLHDLLCDDNVSMDWPLTEGAARSLRDSFVSATSSRPEIPLSRAPMNRVDVPAPLRPTKNNPRPRAAAPTIPDRRSSLLRRQNNPRESRAAERTSISSSQFFSHVANLR